MTWRSTIIAGLLLGLLGGALCGLSGPRVGGLLATSLSIAAGAAAVSVLLGTVLGWCLYRGRVAGQWLAEGLLLLGLFMPLYLHAAAWEAGFGRLGWYTVARGALARPLLSGWTASIWVHGLAGTPWVALLTGYALRHINPQWEARALLDAPAWQVAWRVSLPARSGAILAGAVWVAVSSLSEMTVADLYGVRTYAEELYTGLALGDSWREAWLVCLPGIIWCSGAGLVCLGIMRAGLRAGATGESSQTHALERHFAHKLATATAWCLLFAVVALPLGNLLFNAGVAAEMGAEGDLVRRWSPARVAEVVLGGTRTFRGELGWSLAVAATAASLSLLVAVPLALLARQGGWKSLPVMILVAGLLAIPGPLVGLQMLHSLNREGTLGWLYRYTVLAPTLVQAIRALPATLLVAWYHLATLPAEFTEQARLEGHSAWRRFWTLIFPLRRGALATAWLVGLAVAIGDLSATVMVVPPSLTLVPQRVFGLIHAGVRQDEAALSLLAVTLSAAVAALVLAMHRAPARANRFAGRDS